MAATPGPQWQIKLSSLDGDEHAGVQDQARHGSSSRLVASRIAAVAMRHTDKVSCQHADRRASA